MEQLRKLAKPIPESLIEKVKKGSGPQLSYVSHSTITELLLGILGPYSMSVEPVRGRASEMLDHKTGEIKFAAVENAIVGALVTLKVTVDGREVSVTEAGDVENPAMKDNDGSRLKDAISDGLKRCAMRLGLGLHLWSGEGYMLSRGLEAKAKAPEPREAPEAPQRGSGGAREAVRVGKQEVEPIQEDEPPFELDEPQRLSPERAAAMARELEKLGFAGELGTELARQQLGRRVTAFTELEDSEAAEVWSAAKKQAAMTWQSWNDPDAPLKWTKDAVGVTGERLWNAWTHIENSYEKLERELEAAGVTSASEINRHWFIKVGLKRLGLEYTPRREDERALFEAA